MNTFSTIDTTYLKPNRTIDTILLSNSNNQRVLWVYNYEGKHFRVFHNVQDVAGFLSNNFEPIINFENEVELDEFLTNVNLSTLEKDMGPN